MSLTVMTGMVLVLTTLIYHTGLALMFLRGEFGRVLRLPHAERPVVMARHLGVYRWGYRMILAAWIVAALGYVMLAGLLQETGSSLISTLSSTLFPVAIVMAAVFWVLEAPSTLAAARQLAESSTPPPYDESMQLAAHASLMVYQIVGLLATAGFGVALLQSNLLPAWIGWITFGWGAFWTAALLTMSDGIPLLPMVMQIVIGAALLLRG